MLTIRKITVSVIPKVIINGLTLSISVNTGATTVVNNTRLRLDVKSASCFS